MVWILNQTWSNPEETDSRILGVYGSRKKAVRALEAECSEMEEWFKVNKAWPVSWYETSADHVMWGSGEYKMCTEIQEFTIL